MERIQAPEFPDVDFSILDFGARSGMEYDSRPAVIEAVNACNLKGGGRVVVPPGVFYMGGPITLKSHVNLHLEEGARLVFSTEPSDYLPLVLTKWEGTECYNYSPFIAVTNVSTLRLREKEKSTVREL
ncbi:MAG: hypothetical protein LUD68_08555 [Rikenellaceae bacterium]|nr:hypothetical protein [Rikenellaceae bacterium]